VTDNMTNGDEAAFISGLKLHVTGDYILFNPTKCLNDWTEEFPAGYLGAVSAE
jgi:hypothetical protein